MEVLLLGLVVIVALVWLGFWFYFSTRRGEKCPGYPYNCMYCRHAAECIIEIGKDVKR